MEEVDLKKSDEASQHRRPRTFYIDNIRTSLSALVIFHHTAICYGGEGIGPYQSSLHPRASSLGLLSFNAVNQSFFMGSFFYISGYFTHKSLARKSTGSFVKDRLYRLGLPTLAYTFLGPPATRAITKLVAGDPLDISILTSYWSNEVRGIRGHTWFTGNLLLLDILYACISHTFRKSQKKSVGKQNQNPNDPHVSASERNKILAFAFSVIGCFLGRLVYPVGTNFTPLGLQPGYAPQYVSAYISGTRVHDLMEGSPSPEFRKTLGLLSATTSALLLAAIVREPSNLDQIWGGWNKMALLYAIWNESTGYLIASSVFSTSKKLANFQWGSLANYAYPAFIIHMLPLTFFGHLTDTWDANGILKTTVIGAISTVASWALGYGCSKAFWCLGL